MFSKTPILLGNNEHKRRGKYIEEKQTFDHINEQQL